MTKLRTSHEKWSKNAPAFRKVYEGLEEQFELAAVIAGARGRAGLTQEEVAKRMRTTQSNIARMEAGRTSPSTRTLEKFAQAVGARLRISFEPVSTR